MAPSLIRAPLSCDSLRCAHQSQSQDAATAKQATLPKRAHVPQSDLIFRFGKKEVLHPVLMLPDSNILDLDLGQKDPAIPEF